MLLWEEEQGSTGPMSNEVSLLGSVLYRMPCFPGIVSNGFVRPFFITFGWWFTSSRKVRYSPYRRPAHFESLDHYMSFFLAPAMAWGPFWVTLALSWSLWLWDSRVPFFMLSIYPYCLLSSLWDPFLEETFTLPWEFWWVCVTHIYHFRNIFLSHFG